MGLCKTRGVGNERNLVHLVENISWNQSWEIKADFLEIKLGNQPNPPAPPTLRRMTSFQRKITGKSKRNQEIKEKLGNLVRQNCSLPTPRTRVKGAHRHTRNFNIIWDNVILEGRAIEQRCQQSGFIQVSCTGLICTPTELNCSFFSFQIMQKLA